LLYAPNGVRYRRLVENQARKRNPAKAQKNAKKRAAYQPSGARRVGGRLGTQDSKAEKRLRYHIDKIIA
jgi:hypothetical protein